MATKPRPKTVAKRPAPKVSHTPIKKGGRPKKLIADEATLKQVRGLGQIQATVREGAAFFNVNLTTFERFLDEPGVRDEWDAGKGHGQISLRRKQIELANNGNATMLIWLGKNHLGQSDKSEVDVKGAMNVSFNEDEANF